MLKSIEQLPSRNVYSLTEPAYIIILHTTLGAYTGAVSWLRNLNGQNPNSSAHLVVGRMGETAQLAPFTKGTWHAGGVSNPSSAARTVCRKQLWGSIKNPNRYTIGIEVACGYDIDRDGVLESWEKLYTSAQIKQVAELILHIEKQTVVKFSSKHILTHRDIASYKPNLDIQKAMVLTELAKLRNPQPPVVPSIPAPPVDDKVFLNDGDRVKGRVENDSIKLVKI